MWSLLLYSARARAIKAQIASVLEAKDMEGRSLVASAAEGGSLEVVTEVVGVMGGEVSVRAPACTCARVVLSTNVNLNSATDSTNTFRYGPVWMCVDVYVRGKFLSRGDDVSRPCPKKYRMRELREVFGHLYCLPCRHWGRHPSSAMLVLCCCPNGFTDDAAPSCGCLPSGTNHNYNYRSTRIG